MNTMDSQLDIYNCLVAGGAELIATEFLALKEEKKPGAILVIARYLESLLERNIYYKRDRYPEKAHEQLSFEAFPPEEMEEIVEGTIEPEEKKPGRKSGPNKKSLINTEGLEKIIIEHPIESDKCPSCGEQMKLVSYTEQKILKRQPAKTYLEIHRYPVYECPVCFNDEGEPVTSTPEKEPTLLGDSPASAQLVASIAAYCYQAGLPFYRQETLYEEEGLPLTRQTMVNWLDRAYELYVHRLIAKMFRDFQNLNYVHLDESPLKVVRNRRERGTNYELIGVSGRSEEKQMVLYQYSPDRTNAIVPMMIGHDFHGTIQSDGYQDYHSYGKSHEHAKCIGCWSHAMIKIKDGLNVDPHFKKLYDLPEEEQQVYVDAHPKTKGFYQLYILVSRLMKNEDGLDPDKKSWEEIHQDRQQKSRILFRKIYDKVKEMESVYPPSSKKGAALTYLNNQKEYLEGTLSDGRYALTNMVAERLVKRFILWRKNSLFSVSEGGADRMSGYMSLLMSARLNHLNPEAYLSWVLTEMSTKVISDKELERLLPYSMSIPEELRIQ